MEEMELKVQEITLPDIIKFNYEELKNELAARCEFYETAVYSDENIKQAKADKAMLNKLKKALNDERIKREREYMQPFNDFKSKVNELIGIIDKPVAMIDTQVKAYEEQQKQAKKADIIAFWESEVDAGKIHPELKFEMIFDPKWLNASFNMSAVKEEVTFAADNFKANMDVLSKLPEFSFEAMQTYISCLDLQKAINEANRLSEMARKKAEMEAKKEETKAEPEPQPVEEKVVTSEPERTWVYMQVKVYAAEMAELRNYLKAKGIEYSEI